MNLVVGGHKHSVPSTILTQPNTDGNPHFPSPPTTHTYSHSFSGAEWRVIFQPTFQAACRQETVLQFSHLLMSAVLIREELPYPCLVEAGCDDAIFLLDSVARPRLKLLFFPKWQLQAVLSCLNQDSVKGSSSRLSIYLT